MTVDKMLRLEELIRILSKTIQIIRATKADQPEWDSFVLANPSASPYQLFAWGEAIAKAYGHNVYNLMARQNGQIKAVLPMVHLKIAFFLNELVALPYCDVGNCLISDSAIEEQLLVEVLKIGQQLKTKNIQLRGQLNSINKLNFSLTLMDTHKVRMVLDLPASSEVLLHNFKSKLRSQVLKAEKNGIIFRWAGQNGVDSFYSVFCRNMRDLGSPVHSIKLFRAIMEKFGENARIGLAEFEGECIGAGLILSTNKQTAIPWASTLREYNQLAPNMLLYWNFLKFASDTGKKTFDFGRSTENEGTFRFKKQWGAKPIPLPWYFSSSSVRQVIKERNTNELSRERLAEIWKTMPVPIANLLGPQVRKYISL